MIRPEMEAELGLGGGALTRFLDPSARFSLTRFLMLRLLGLVYVAAFASSVFQNGLLIGEGGLLPAKHYVLALAANGSAMRVAPSVFHLIGTSDAALSAVAGLGLALSVTVALGVTNALVNFVLWMLYLSLVQVGQEFYSYGWELQLCETGLLAVFLAPLNSLRPFPSRPPAAVVLWLFRWLIVRVMLGAGLIKLRGDSCWQDLTCLDFHFETQPIPGPFSAFFHRLPGWLHSCGVLLTLFIELLTPLGAFGPRRLRISAGVLFVGLQALLIVSGNLSFFNWLTIVAALACFDDAALERVTPRWLAACAASVRARPSRASLWCSGGFAGYVALLSIDPVANLASPRQAMNKSFEPLHMVNSYGAFGGVNRERLEVVLEGSKSSDPADAQAWREYVLPCKPGPTSRPPCWLSPYQRRLDWQLWFLSSGTVEDHPWFVRLVAKLLAGDHQLLSEFAVDPFAGEPPTWVRARLFRYQFGSGETWERVEVGEYLRPVDRFDPELVAYLEALERVEP